MAKKSGAKNNKPQQDGDAVTAANAPAVNVEAEAMSPLTRIGLIIVTSYLAEKIWSQRKIVTDAWYSSEQTATEVTMVTIFEYLAAMGMLFGSGIAIGVVLTKGSRYLPKLFK